MKKIKNIYEEDFIDRLEVYDIESDSIYFKTIDLELLQFFPIHYKTIGCDISFRIDNGSNLDIRHIILEDKKKTIILPIQGLKGLFIIK